MLPALSDVLTERFYAWEQRGRGWQAFDFSVELEPEFHPFFGHYAPTLENTLDDSKRPTILSSLASLFQKKKPTHVAHIEWVEIPPVSAYEYESDHHIKAYTVVLPKDEKFKVEDMEQLLLMLSYTEHPVSFEIIATSAAISLQFICRESDTAHVYGQIKAYFPSAVITKSEKGLDILGDEAQTCVLDFGLRDEFTRPLRMAYELDQDPYKGLFATLEQVESGERGIVQILFKGSINPWPESMMRAVSDGGGGSFFADAPDMVKLAQEKVSAPLYAVTIRAAGQAKRGERAIEIAQNIGAALIRLTGSKDNTLQMLSQDEYPLSNLIDDLLLRESHRLGMLLNVGELATLAHFPTSQITSEKHERVTRKTKLPPAQTKGHPFVLGKNIHHGQEADVSVPASLRLRHTHVIGATGTGKSTLLLSMIAQDMAQGNGLAVFDPHGDLIEAALAHVPENRINDVILIDPADGEYPVAFNILSAHSEIEKDILSSDLVAAFRRLSTSWGDQMNSVLANAILVFLESTEGGTLVDLRRFLLEKSFREEYLKTVQDPHVVYYWQHEYPLLKSSSIGSILTRLDTFLRPTLIRNMVAQKKGLDFEQILDSKKILLVKLSQGLIGAENSFLLGTFFVSKMYQAAMARQARSKEARSDFFLYIDEFQNFITPSMSHILSGARKYHLGLILAHQDMQQLQKYDSELASSVVVNAGTRICFRLGDTDARRFAGGFSYFEAEDLENLKTGEAIARVEQPNFDFNLVTIPLPEVGAEEAEVRGQAVITASRATYGNSRSVVEEGFAKAEPVIPKAVVIEDVNECMAEAIPSPPSQPFVPVEIPQKPVVAKKAETEHRYLQMLIKRIAESRGYKAMIEEVTPDGKGRVDVSLEREGKRIAVEVSVTTEKEWEVHNTEKCLAAGYDDVIICSKDARHLLGIRKQLEQKLGADQMQKVFTFDPTEAVQYFDRQTIPGSTTEKLIKGYRVKVDYNTATSEEMNKKHVTIARAITTSTRKNIHKNKA